MQCVASQEFINLGLHALMVHSPLFASHLSPSLSPVTEGCSVRCYQFLSLSTPGIRDPLSVFWPTAPPFPLISRPFHVSLILTWLWTSPATHLPCLAACGGKAPKAHRSASQPQRLLALAHTSVAAAQQKYPSCNTLVSSALLALECTVSLVSQRNHTSDLHFQPFLYRC